jgi:hypothetical protein
LHFFNYGGGGRDIFSADAAIKNGLLVEGLRGDYQEEQHSFSREKLVTGYRMLSQVEGSSPVVFFR